jgi:hypothetical protein
VKRKYSSPDAGNREILRMIQFLMLTTVLTLIAPKTVNLIYE